MTYTAMNAFCNCNQIKLTGGPHVVPVNMQHIALYLYCRWCYSNIINVNGFKWSLGHCAQLILVQNADITRWNRILVFFRKPFLIGKF